MTSSAPASPAFALGADLVPVSRIRELLRSGPDLAARVFTARELDYCRAYRVPDEHLAARFAAKEAVFKALGTGLGPGMEWTDVEIVNRRGGRPEVRLHGAAARCADELGADSIGLSVSHGGGLALAIASLGRGWR